MTSCYKKRINKCFPPKCKWVPNNGCKSNVEDQNKTISNKNCPKFELLGNGVYGCVVIPAIGNNYTINIDEKYRYDESSSRKSQDKDIGKIFINERSFIKELSNMKIAKAIDPNGLFTVKMKGAVRVPKTVLQCNRKLVKCLKVSKDQRYFQIIYENGGMNIESKFKISFMSFLLLFKNFLKGMTRMYKKGYIHWDIKPDNVVINRSKMSLIDFGNMLKADTLFSGKYKTVNHYRYPKDTILAMMYFEGKIHLTDSVNEFKKYTEYILKTQTLNNDLRQFLEDNKNKSFHDVFNKELAFKSEVFAISYIIEEFLNKISDLSSNDKIFLQNLISKCRHRNPDKRINIIQLYNTIIAKLRRSKQSGGNVVFLQDTFCLKP